MQEIYAYKDNFQRYAIYVYAIKLWNNKLYIVCVNHIQIYWHESVAHIVSAWSTEWICKWNKLALIRN
jgi:hypothetical protein